MAWFWIGFAAGITLTIPLTAVAARRTERRVRRLEQKARATERLAELGKLTGGLAHEIKNPLSTIGLNMQLIGEDLHQLAVHQHRDTSNLAEASSDQLLRVQRRFEALSRETSRLRDILDEFLRYAGRVKLDRVEIDINALVDELADFFGPEATATNVQLRTQLAANPAMVQADPSLLKQAMLNLMINAVQAMKEARSQSQHGGCDELIIRTHHERSLGQDAILIHVTDTGSGLDPDAANKIFQPYFSTKSGGTGLGLPTTRRIVEEHGGALQVYSEVGRGCDFVIRLPVEPLNVEGTP